MNPQIAQMVRRWVRPVRANRLARRRMRATHHLTECEQRLAPAVLPVPTVDRASFQSITGGFEPQAAYDPFDPSRVVLVSTDGVGIDARYSTDGGLNWTRFFSDQQPPTAPPPATPGTGFRLRDPLLGTSSTNQTAEMYTNTSTPSVAFARDGRVYISRLQHNTDRGSGALVVNAWDFSGTSPALIDLDPTDKADNGNANDAQVVYRWVGRDPAYNPSIAVNNNLPTFTDPQTGQVWADSMAARATDPAGRQRAPVYVVWNANATAPSAGTGSTGNVFNANAIFAAASEDGGLNFTTQVPVSDGGYFGGSSAAGTAPQVFFTPLGSASPGRLAFVWSGVNSGPQVAGNNGLMRTDVSQPDNGLALTDQVAGSYFALRTPGTFIADASQPSTNNTPPFFLDALPTLLLASAAKSADLTVNFSDTEDAAASKSPTFTAVSLNPAVAAVTVVGGTGGSATISVQAQPNATAATQQAVIRLTLTDNGGTGGTKTAVATFTVNVDPAAPPGNNLPLFTSAVPTVVMTTGTSTSQTINVSDIETAAGALAVTAVSSNPAIVSVGVSGTGSARSIDLNALAVGQAQVTVTVDDGTGGTTTTVFTVNSSQPASGDSAAVTTDSMTVTIPDGAAGPEFGFLKDLNVMVAIRNPQIDTLRVELIPTPALQARLGVTAITLLESRVGSDGKNRGGLNGLPTRGLPGAGVQSTDSYADVGLGLSKNFPAGTWFDDEAARFANDSAVNASPYIGYYRPDTTVTAALAQLYQSGDVTEAELEGKWQLRITDVRNDRFTNPPGNRRALEAWGLRFASGIDTGGFGNDTTVTTPSGVAETLKGGVLFNSNPTTGTASPTVGFGPGVSVAVDNSLGSFNPTAGNVYLAYTANASESILFETKINRRRDVFLVTGTLDAGGGITWGDPVRVNDDSRLDHFTEGDREQFMPAVTVDDATGTVVTTWYDARWDASNVRLARYVATSIDGGATFSPQTYLDPQSTAKDIAAGGAVVVIEPIPSNLAAVPGTDGFGLRQALLAHGGSILPFWTGNLNSTGTSIFTAPVRTAAGPRVVAADMGPVTAASTDANGNVYNNTPAADGTRMLDGFQVTFDRPIDPSSFDVTDVQVLFRPAGLALTSPGTVVPLAGVVPLDDTHFFIQFQTPQSGVGTYSYAVGPDIRDRVASPNGPPPVSNTLTQNTPVVLADPGVVTSTVAAPAGTVAGVTVRVNLTHTWVGDLRLTLVSPTGTRVILFDQHGTSGNDLTNTVFSDATATAIAAGTAPFTGTFQPDEALAAFVGEAAGGNWTLEIEDFFAPDTGTLLDWSLTLFVPGTGTGNPMDQDADGVAGELDNDTFANPRNTNGQPLSFPYDDATTLPLVIPGPRVIATSAAGINQSRASVGSTGTDNLVLNAAANSITVTFDRDMNPATFTDADVLGMSGPTGALVLTATTLAAPLNPGDTTLTVTTAAGLPQRDYLLRIGSEVLLVTATGGNVLVVTRGAYGSTPNAATVPAGTTARLTFQVVPVSARQFTVMLPYPVSVSGPYSLQLGAHVADTLGNELDTNTNAGVAILRGGADPSAAANASRTYNSSAAPLTIPARAAADGVVEMPLDVTDLFAIQQLVAGTRAASRLIQLRLDIDHANTPDLTADLVAPDGTTIRLFSGVGTLGSSRADFDNTLLDDWIGNTPIQSGSPPFFNGPFNPQFRLSDLIGMQGQGQWRLRVTNIGTQTGTLNNWSLTLPYVAATSGLGEDVADRVQVGFRVFIQDPTDPAAGDQWTPVGPAPNTGGTTARIGALAADPSDPSGNTFFAGASTGGIWKTTDFLNPAGGPTWVPLTDFGPASSLNIGSLAVFPRNNDPAQSIVFALSGDGDGGRGGVGVLRSMDGGKTWVVLDSSNNTDSPTVGSGNITPISSASRDHTFVGTTGFKIIVDPTLTPTGEVIVYMANSKGVWRSNDTGKHWTNIQAGNASDVALAAGSAGPNGNLQILYAAFRENGKVYYTTQATSALTLFQTSDLSNQQGNPLVRTSDGKSAIPVSAPSTTPNDVAHDRVSLAVPGLTNDPVKNLFYQGWVYALVVSPGAGTFAGLYLSKDFGRNWTRVRLPELQPTAAAGAQIKPGYGSNNESNPEKDVFGGGGGLPAQGNYDLGFAIDPQNPHILYIAGTENGARQPSGAVIRVDTSVISDAHSLVPYNYSQNDGGTTKNAGTANASAVITDTSKDWGLGASNEAYFNLLRDPDNVFVSDSTLKLSNITRFRNTGFDAKWAPYAPAEVLSDVHRIFTYVDPLTGLTRVVMGDDHGVGTTVDQNGTASTAGIGFAPGVPLNRNGNLQITQLYNGAVQPSQLAADIAGAMFYGMAQDDGYPSSAPDIIQSGQNAWTGGSGAGDAFDAATDATGSGTSYQFRFPCCGGGDTEFFIVNAPGAGDVGRTNGLIQAGDNPVTSTGQWGYVAGYKFAVNPVDPRGIVVTSSAGRIFRTVDQGLNWFPIAEPGAAGGNVSKSVANALAFGAPDPVNSPGLLNNFIYFGTASGNLYVTLTGSGSFVDISLGLNGSSVQAIVTNPLPGSASAFAVTSNGVFYLADARLLYANPTNPAYGWVNVTGNLFAIQKQVFGSAVPGDTRQAIQGLTSIQADWRYAIPYQYTDGAGAARTVLSPILYAGGGGGVVRSLDFGRTWELFPSIGTDGAQQDGGWFPSASVTDLDFSLGDVDPATGIPNQAYGYNMLVATTYGRGMFAIRLNSDDIVLTGVTLADGTNPTAGTYNVNFQPGPRVVGVSSPDTGGVTDEFIVQFAGPVDPVTFTTADVLIYDPAGNPVTVTGVQMLSTTVAGTGNPRTTYRITFTPQDVGADPAATGHYRLVIGPSSDPAMVNGALSDLAGNRMNQDGNGKNGVTDLDAYDDYVYVNGDAASLLVTGLPTQVRAGDKTTITVTAYAPQAGPNVAGTAITGFRDKVTFAFSDPNAKVYDLKTGALLTDYTFTAADAGTRQFQVMFVDVAAPSTLTVTNVSAPPGPATNPAKVDTTVVAAAADHFVFSVVPASFLAGSSSMVEVQAQDQFGNIDTAYAGTVTFTSSDANAILPGTYTFTAGDAGKATFPVTFRTVDKANGQSLIVTDNLNPAIRGVKTNIVVNAEKAASLVVTTAPPTAAQPAAQLVAGIGGTFYVSALDPYGNVADGAQGAGYEYTGTVALGTTHPALAGVSVPGSVTFAAGDAGTKPFAVTLTKTGTWDLTAVDVLLSPATAALPVAVNANVAKTIALTGPGNMVAGVPSNFTVTAYDQFGNVADGNAGGAYKYAANVQLTSTHPAGAGITTPTTVTFTGSEGGKRVVPVTLTKVGFWDITATDAVLPGTSTLPVVRVDANVAASLTLTAAQTKLVAGVPGQFTVTAYDAYGNVADGAAGAKFQYTGDVDFATAPGGSGLSGVPALPYTFTAADAGVKVFDLTLTKVGTYKLTASDAAIPASASVTNVQVNANVAAQFSIAGPLTLVAGVAQDFTVKALDKYGNVADGLAGTAYQYKGTLDFTSTEVGGTGSTVPFSYTFDGSENGVRAFPIALSKVGTWDVTARDAAIPAQATKAGIDVLANAPVDVEISGPASVVAGIPSAFTVRGVDAYGNTADGRAGAKYEFLHTVTITSTHPTTPGVTPAVPFTFTAADKGTASFQITLTKAGAWDLTVSDLNNLSSGTQPGVVVNANVAKSIALTADQSKLVAGIAGGYTVTAFDVFGNVADGAAGAAFEYTGTVDYVTDHPALPGVSVPPPYTFTPADKGVKSLPLVLTKVGFWDLTATDAKLGSASSVLDIPVDANVGAQFTLAGPAVLVAGKSGSYTLTVYDAYGNVADGNAGPAYEYTADVDFTYPGGVVGVAPANPYTFTAADRGVKTLDVTLTKAGKWDLTATDAVNGITVSQPDITVWADVPYTVGFFGPQPSLVAGIAGTFTVAALDQFGNVADGAAAATFGPQYEYTGTMDFAAEAGSGGSSPPPIALTPADKGVTTVDFTLTKAGKWDLFVTDALLNGGKTGVLPDVDVFANQAASLTIAGPAELVAGIAGDYTVTAYDVYGNVADGAAAPLFGAKYIYTGTVDVTTTQAPAFGLVLPPPYPFTAADKGVKTLPVTLSKVGKWDVTATDPSLATPSVTQSAVEVFANVATSIQLTGPAELVAGVALPYTVTAYDLYGNVADGRAAASFGAKYVYKGTVDLTTTHDPLLPGVVLESPYTFTAADAGVKLLNVALSKVGKWDVTATDAALPSSSTVSQVEVFANQAASLTIAGAPELVAGIEDFYTVTAYDLYGNVADGRAAASFGAKYIYTGAVQVTSTHPTAPAVTPSNPYTFTAADAGVKVLGVTLTKAGSWDVTVTDAAIPATGKSASATQPGVIVYANVAKSLGIVGPAELVAGIAAPYTVTAYDLYGNVADGAAAGTFGPTYTYVGTVSLTTTHDPLLPGVVLESPYTFTAADAGVKLLNVALSKVGKWDVTATDPALANPSATQAQIEVFANVANTIQIVGPTGLVAGIALPYTVTAYDVYGNVADGRAAPSFGAKYIYKGTVDYSTTHDPLLPGVTVPPPYTFTAADAGVKALDIGLSKVGFYDISAEDAALGSKTTQANVEVFANAAASLTVAGAPVLVAGVLDDYVVTAYDQFGNLADGRAAGFDTKYTFTVYTGTVTFSSTQPANLGTVLPTYTFTAADAGVRTLQAALSKVGTWDLTATDPALAAPDATQPGVVVLANQAVSLGIVGPAVVVAGVANDYTVTAYDLYGNVADGAATVFDSKYEYTGTVQFTTDHLSPPPVTLPPPYTFTAADKGVVTLPATLTKVGFWDVTVTDTGLPFATRSATKADVEVVATVANAIVITGSPTLVAGLAQQYTVTAYDVYGNVADGEAAKRGFGAKYTYTGTVALTTNHLTGTPDVVLESPYTFTAADAGVKLLNVALTKVGTWTVTATDPAFAATTQNVTVFANVAKTIQLTGPTSMIAGEGGRYTVTAYDVYGNVADGAATGGGYGPQYTYLGKIDFTSTHTDPFDVLTDKTDATSKANPYTFTAADKGVKSLDVILYKAGQWDLTAADAVLGAASTQKSITVFANAATSMQLTGPAELVAGIAGTFTATVYDEYGNVADGAAGAGYQYKGSVQLSGVSAADGKTSVALGVTPSNPYRFTIADKGVRLFNITITKAGPVDLSITDTQFGSISDKLDATVKVYANVATALEVTGPAALLAGEGKDYTVTARDTFGNVADGAAAATFGSKYTYTGTVAVTATDTDPRVALPADYTFTAADAGVKALPVTLIKSGRHTLTATETGATPSVTAGKTGLIDVYANLAQSLGIAGPATLVAGVTGTYTVTAYDAYGNVADGRGAGAFGAKYRYTGTVAVGSDHPTAPAVGPANPYTFTASDAGVKALTVTLTKASAAGWTLTATDAALATPPASQKVVVFANVAKSIALGGSGPLVAGVAGTFTVTALDNFGNVADGAAGAKYAYLGTVSLTSNHPSAPGVTPAVPYTFTAADAGVKPFQVTLTKAGSWDLAVNDPVLASTATKAGVVVNANVAKTLSVAGTNALVAGVSSLYTVTALDAYGNVANGAAGAGFVYTGAVDLSTAAGSGLTVNPATPYTFTAADAGVKAFGVTLTKAATWTLTAADKALGASASVPGITVRANAAKSLTFAGPTSLVAGIAGAYTVTALDAYGNVANGAAGAKYQYLGTVSLASSPTTPLTVAEGNPYTFTAVDAGVKIVQVTLTKAGTFDLTVTDKTLAAPSATQAGVIVTANAATGVTITGPTALIAGVAQNVTVTATDQFGNVATGAGGAKFQYLGTVRFGTNQPANVGTLLPTDYTFTPADAGVKVLPVTLSKTGTWNVTATDLGLTSVSTLSGVVVTANQAASLTIAGSAKLVAGAALPYTVTALDAYGNVADGASGAKYEYTGTVDLTSTHPTAPGIAPAVPYTFAAADKGVKAFDVTLTRVGAWDLTAADAALGATATQPGIVVNAAAAATLAVTGPSKLIAGVSDNYTVTAYDQFGNVADGKAGLGFAYTGVVTLTTDQPPAAGVVLPGAYTFTSFDAGVKVLPVTLTQTGTWKLTATDPALAAPAELAGIAVTANVTKTIDIAGPAGLVAGNAAGYTVTARDAFGNVADGASGAAYEYTGTVSVTTTHPAAAGVVLPAAYTFQPGDRGSKTLDLTLVTAGTYDVTATDAGLKSSGTQAGVVVNANVAKALEITGPGSLVAGTPGGYTVTARDAFGNVADGAAGAGFGYTGTVDLTSTHPAAAGVVLPSHTFTAADLGVATLQVTLTQATAGGATWSLTATDPNLAAPSATKAGVVVNANVAKSLAITAPASFVAGVARNVTVTALDAFGNVANGAAGALFVYTGTVALGSDHPGGAGVTPSNPYTFGPADAGKRTFGVTFTKANAAGWALTATDAALTTPPASQTAVVNANAAKSLTITGPGALVAGNAGAYTVTALDQFGNVADGKAGAAFAYTGTVTLGTSHPLTPDMKLPAPYPFTAADGGVKALDVTLTQAGVWAISASDTVLGATASRGAISVAANVAKALTLTGPAATVAGEPGVYTATALDAFGNVADGAAGAGFEYTGTLAVATNDPNATLPPGGVVQFSKADRGTKSFSTTLRTAGGRTVTVTDAAPGVAGATAATDVSPAAGAVYVLSGLPAAVGAGAATGVTVEVRDRFGNVATGYTGTIAFASTDTQATLPGRSAFTTADAGRKSFPLTLRTAGPQTIAATDAVDQTVAGTAGTTVTAAPATAFTVAGFASPTVAGASGSVVVTARDAFGNLAAGYTGTVVFSATDRQAGLPTAYTFAAGDNGSKAFDATFKTAGVQSLSVTDGKLTGTKTGIEVTPAAAVRVVVAEAPTATTAGDPVGFRVTMLDAFGNTATGYAGTVAVRSTDGQAVLPGNYAFTQADAGVHRFNVALRTAGGQSVTVADAGNVGVSAGTTGTISVAPAKASRFDVTGLPAQASAQQPTGFTVTARDAFGNVATGYTGQVRFSSTDGEAILPAAAGLASGAGGFQVTFRTAGTHALTATDTRNEAVTGTQGGVAVRVTPASNPTAFAVGTDAGTQNKVTVYNSDLSVRSEFVPFEQDFTGGARVALGRYPGGLQVVVASGPGRQPDVRVFDADKGLTNSFIPFETTFTGGLLVATGDIDQDGFDDYAVSADQGGGPRVKVVSGRTGAQLIDFFGIDDKDFRGGARVALGDVTGDGVPDLIVAAGFGGGPRVAGFDGAAIAKGRTVKLFNDFFAFEPELRNGVFVAVGDVDGDGKGDLIVGAGPGGGPRVTIFAGPGLLDNALRPIANFFGGDPNNRGGVRVAVTNLDQDDLADVVVGSGEGAGSQTTGYTGAVLRTGNVTQSFDLTAFDGFTGGVFVG